MPLTKPLITLACLFALTACAQTAAAPAIQATEISSRSTGATMLTTRQQDLALIGKYTARGDQTALAAALNQALDNGLSVNEAKDALVQLYAYCGFPRSLNALTTLMNVTNSRKAQGIATREGRTATPLPADTDILHKGTQTQTELVGQPVSGALFDFAPDADRYLKTHLFGDIFASDLLNWQEREIITIAALANINGVESQLNAHKAIGKHNGLTDEQLQAIEAL
ncbi:carboxymuconolactone decarboxylase family protein [Uruburuella testudinis]|uniref:Carboxymuconolactone decarboxylase family protein n=2 Tax=Pseudomonadota TaxID=1224 RepID=A0ABY4DR43_9NEIS|nr:carboxymuconolactone decarboxylase family protein [Uruburuella testudinis]UOO81082.1 carboxymuconolactone decarboxylase family protein [Uruburuella testudinis]